jgi:hypothetical protein
MARYNDYDYSMKGKFSKRLLHCIRRFFLGPDIEPIPPEKLGIGNQCKCLRQVWNSESFGLYRLMRLTLCIAPFAFPMLWITQALRKANTNLIHISSDVYIVLRAGILAGILFCSATQSLPATLITSYFLLDLLMYVSAIVFLADVYGPPISAHRTLLLILFNYGEVILVFASLHRQWGGLNIEHLCPIQAFYFSMVTATTLGYGDISPATSSAQLRVVAQLVVSIVFVSVFLSAALSRISVPKNKE